ncbi:MAG: hypothetical protein ACI9QN_000664 [Arcticibacterium sp.]|jgi:hypothetical protein
MREIVITWKKQASQEVNRRDETSRLDNLKNSLFNLTLKKSILNVETPRNVTAIIAFTQALPSVLICITLFLILLILSIFSIDSIPFLGKMVYTLYGSYMYIRSRNYNNLEKIISPLIHLNTLS